MIGERLVRKGLVVNAVSGLALGLAFWFAGREVLAGWLWAAGTLPVVIGLAISMTRDLLAGRMGVDAVALVSMSAALLLGEYLAGAVVALMYAGGNLLEDFAVARAERDLKALVDRAPRIAHRRSGETVEDIAAADIAAGDCLLVRGGEVVPADGMIMSEGAMLDESALTGEPIPHTRAKGERIWSGTVNAGDTFAFSATASAGESAYAGIVRMVTAAQTAKAPFIRVADRYALVLLPVTLVLAGAAWLLSQDPVRGLAVLVASTPCPLILAAPVAFIAGVSRAARRGVLIKGSGPLEALARIRTALLDKTGTLTVGGARVIAIETAPGVDADTILMLAGSLEQASHHVVAAAIVSDARARGLSLVTPEHVRETMGSGLHGLVSGKTVTAGSYPFVAGHKRPAPWAARALRRATWRSALTVFVSFDGEIRGAILLGDELRPEAPRAVHALRSAGVQRIVMVTGDQAEAAETIGAALNLDAVLADRVPADKVDAVALERRAQPTMMVGDGINDAPALAAADVGIAMGARGASASSEAADVVIMVDRLDRVSDAVAIAHRTRSIALQSIWAGMGLSGLAMLAAAFGYLTPVAAALTQEAIDVAVILNALRALTPGWHPGRPTLKPSDASVLWSDHEALGQTLDRLQAIADALDEADPDRAVLLIGEANMLVMRDVVAHERDDENRLYPELAQILPDRHGLTAMSRAHREILHQARLLACLADGLTASMADRFLVRDAQRVIEAVESLVRLHNAQEEDIYEDLTIR